jgi:hypothetical protein
MRISAKTSLAAVSAGVMTAAIAVPSGASGVSAHAAACVKAFNIEAIVDDSGSMGGTDPNRLRVQGLDLLINTLSSGTFLGAVEFGDSFTTGVPSADTVFAPQTVGPNGPAMKSALNAKIHADNGGTDYNSAFAQSDSDNPLAAARIFLTDGGHNAGTYNNGHLVRRVPTYVVGFSPGLASATDQARLKQIASDTGGHYYPLADSSQIQAVINKIGAALTCQSPPASVTDQLAAGRSSRVHSFGIGSKIKTAQIALTWSSPLDKFTITGLSEIRNGKQVAVAARARRLKVTTSHGQTFLLVKVSKLVKGSLHFRVRALRVRSVLGKATITTQVGRR